MDIMAALAVLFTTIVSGLVYSYVVFKKSTRNEEETFNPAKLKRTVIISTAMGLIFAIISYWKGISINEADVWFTNSEFGAFVVVVIDQVMSYFMPTPEPEPPSA